MEELVKLNSEGAAFLLVPHDSRVASGGDRIICLLDGQISAELERGVDGDSNSRALSK